MKSKLLKALLSAAIALGLWLYVVTFISPTYDNHYQNIPVTLQGEALLHDRGLMITTTETPKVSLHLEGSRTNLGKLNTSNITIEADVSKIGEPGTHNLTYTVIPPGDVPNNSITILSQSPGVITVNVENRVSKEVPVELRYLGTLPEGYMVDKENKVLSHKSVMISGPQSAVDRITAARIDVELEQRKESIRENFKYTLCDSMGDPVDAKLITTDVESVTLMLRVLRVKEVQLLINVIDGGGASSANSDITITPNTILISGSGSLLEGLDSIELGTVNLSEILQDTVLTFPIKLPEGVTNETGVEEATVDIQFSKLATKALSVSKIEAINVPEGMTAQLITQRLEISIRGPKRTVESVDASKIKVVVDCSNAQLGMTTIRAHIVVDADNVGAVGNYNVTANLRKAR